MAIENASLKLIVVEFIKQEVDLSFADGQTQVICGDGFDGVCFVEDDGLIIGQDIGAIAAECQVREEQSVVDDQQIRIPDSPSCRVVKAFGVCGAFFAEAVTVITVDFIPDIHGWLE